MMKGLPLSDEMARAWHEGRLTVHRRLMKPQPIFLPSGECGYPYPVGRPNDKRWRHYASEKHFRKGVAADFAPYRPGETVYIKETWRVGTWCDADEAGQSIAVDYKADNYSRREWLDVSDPEQFNKLWIQSTDDAEKVYGKFEHYEWEPGQSPCRWRSPRFMPEWASRSHALIVSVRPERVQEITFCELLNEGMEVDTVARYVLNEDGIPIDCYPEPDPSTLMEQFADLWESLHPGSWEKNEWVWRIELEAR